MFEKVCIKKNWILGISPQRKYFMDNHKNGIFCIKYTESVLFLKRGHTLVKKNPWTQVSKSIETR